MDPQILSEVMKQWQRMASLRMAEPRWDTDVPSIKVFSWLVRPEDAYGQTQHLT